MCLRFRQQIPPKRQYISTSLHGVTSQKVYRNNQLTSYFVRKRRTHCDAAGIPPVPRAATLRTRLTSPAGSIHGKSTNLVAMDINLPSHTQQWMNQKSDGAENGDALRLLKRRQSPHPPAPHLPYPRTRKMAAWAEWRPKHAAPSTWHWHVKGKWAMNSITELLGHWPPESTPTGLIHRVTKDGLTDQVIRQPTVSTGNGVWHRYFSPPHVHATEVYLHLFFNTRWMLNWPTSLSGRFNPPPPGKRTSAHVKQGDGLWGPKNVSAKRKISPLRDLNKIHICVT